ncbi:heavy-metal-associated domain-containing protein [soil metagenome]
MVTESFVVKGMTCGHCVQAVSDEVGALVGVQSVEVDLDTGAVVVTSDAPVAMSDLVAAVDEAGYEVVE